MKAEPFIQRESHGGAHKLGVGLMLVVSSHASHVKSHTSSRWANCAFLAPNRGDASNLGHVRPSVPLLFPSFTDVVSYRLHYA